MLLMQSVKSCWHEFILMQKWVHRYYEFRTTGETYLCNAANALVLTGVRFVLAY